MRHQSILDLAKVLAESCSGPLIIGGKVRWKFPKIRVLCMDKFSKISPNMLGSQQACLETVKFHSDGPSGCQKIQICLDQPIRPPKMAILFGSASKNCYCAPKQCKCYIILNSITLCSYRPCHLPHLDLSCKPLQ